MGHIQSHHSESAEQMVALGVEIGRRLGPGDVVALHGPLGAGKTTLVKGIAASLGIDEAVTSPSFTLIAEYEASRRGRLFVLYHVDLYRVSDPREIEDLGLEEIMGGQGICVIEWAEKAQDFLPDSSIHVQIDLREGSERNVTVEGMSVL